MFHVGQRVVCVCTRRWPRGLGYTPALPKKGCVYTVRAIVPCRLYGYDEDGLHLVEIVNPTRTKSDGRTFELAFRMSRFKPRTNIDLFKAMLEPQPAVELIGWKTTKREPIDA